MIAEPRSRRRGLGREALELFMAFAVHTLACVALCCQSDRHLNEKVPKAACS